MLYTVAIGLSAFLLFLIEPLISKILLPRFGGGASIWITSLVFFQAMLLVGYGFTHFVVRRIGLQRHMILTALLLAVSLVFLPVAVGNYQQLNLPPAAHLTLLLATAIGAPYFMLSTASPTLQYWIANDARLQQRNPYVLYGVSNLGSIAGLLTYPFILEPRLGNTPQSWLWSGLYLGYVGLMVWTIAQFLLYNRSARLATADTRLNLASNLRVRWIFQAMVPSALLIVVTHYLTLDVVNLPLLWIAPLILYLLSFVICFFFPAVSTPRPIRSLLGVLAILSLFVANHENFEFGFEVKLTAGLTCLFIICMIFHGDLERNKPNKRDLTDFYLQIAAGGVLGSLLTTMVAPLIFKSLFEFYVVPMVALYYVVATGFVLRPRLKQTLIASMLVATFVAWLRRDTGYMSDAIYRARSFYSTYTVEQLNTPPRARRLEAGTHIHGLQLIDHPYAHLPVSYYHTGTGISNIYKVLKPSSTALVGLGIGTVIEYGDAHEKFDVYELDPMVIDIAKHYFTILSHTKSHVRFYVGDARVQLREHPRNKYDLVVLDAFNSGSIPTHLVTEEALEEIFDHVKMHGAVAYHISNRRIDLLPVLNAIASRLDLAILYDDSTDDKDMREYAARWAVLTRDRTLIAKLQHEDFGWQRPPPRKVLWTDELSDIWSVMRWD
ncbi:MAG TPA: fused MFS/spermidine synthase [Pseudomonadales bacterium]|nr:fused MFS/spermidine synthase [Pseudomonadales bacterium]